MIFFTLYLAITSVLAASSPIEPLVKVKNFPEPKSLNKKAGFEKIQNGHIERNSDVYGADSWVKDISLSGKSKSIHIECIVNPPGYCETSDVNNPTMLKSGIPYRYQDGKNQYLVIAGKGREDGEEFISILTDEFKELCAIHIIDSYGSVLSKFLKNPRNFLKWNGLSCEFISIAKKTDH